MQNLVLAVWWLAVLWTFTDIMPRPFDDWKNGLLYVGAGIFIIITIKRVLPHKAGSRFVGSATPGTTDAPTTFRNSPSPLLVLRGGVIAYFLFATLSLILAPTARYEGLLELARLVLWLGLAWAFSVMGVRTWLWLMRITVLSAAVIAVLTWYPDTRLTDWLYVGLFLVPIGHITYYGDFMALSLVMAGGLLWQAKSVAQRLLWLGCLGLCLVALAMAGVRASVVGLMAGSLVLFLLSCRKGVRGIVFVVFAVIIGFTAILYAPVPSLNAGRIKGRLMNILISGLTDIDRVSSSRWHTYVTSAHIAMQRPITGWGPGTFRFIYPEYAHRNAPDSQVSSAVWYYHPHNEVLHQAVEVGWLGAALWVLVFGYLLYRGYTGLGPRYIIPSLGTQGGDDGGHGALLATAVCGLAVAFVFWQFSTSFLFPVLRLLTALFAGIIVYFVPHALSHGERMAVGQERGMLKCTLPHPNPLPWGEGKWPSFCAISLIAITTLFLTANQLSLYCVQKEQTVADPRDKWRWATWAVHLAPGAFDPLYVRAAVALQTLPPAAAASDVEALYNRYPYVPAVLQMTGYLRAVQGDFPEARRLLQHAIANDPANSGAKQLLDQLPPLY